MLRWALGRRSGKGCKDFKDIKDCNDCKDGAAVLSLQSLQSFMSFLLRYSSRSDLWRTCPMPSRRALLAFACLLTAPLLHARSPAPPPLLPGRWCGRSAPSCRGRRRCARCRTLTLHHRMRGSRGFRAAAEPIRDRLQADGLRGVEILRCPPTARSSTAPSARGRLERATSPSCGRGGRNWSGDRLLGRAADQPRPGQRGRRADGRSGRRRRGHLRERLSGQGRARPARARPPRSPARSRSWRSDRIGAAGHRLLGAEPAHRLVGRGREPGPLGPSRHVPGADDLRLHGLAGARPRLAGAAARAARRCSCAPRSTPGRAPSAYLIPTAIIPGRDRRAQEIVFSCHLDHPRRAPTTMPAAAPASWRWRGRSAR